MKRTLCTLLAALCVCAAACGCAPGAQSASGAAGPSAASSASSAASSSTSAASAALPASEPAESAPQPAGPAQMQQCMLPVYSGDGPVQTPLYAQADTASDVLAQLMPFDTVFVLREEGEFSEVCFGNWFGWMESSRLPAEAEARVAVPLPEFLTAEQQRDFVRATALFNAYIARNEGLAVDYEQTKAVPREGYDYDLTYALDTAWASYADFDAAMRSLFTDEYLASRLDAQTPFYRDIDGMVYLIEADRGAWSCDVEGYTLTEQTDERIAFDVNFLFTTPVAQHRCSLPAAMERTADGWRFSDFTSGADDTRWMEAMGPDFDPFEGQA